jgi:hypothetical protein
LLSEKRTRKILVDDGLHAGKAAVRPLDDWDAATASAMTMVAWSNKSLVTAASTISSGFGEGTTRRHWLPSCAIRHRRTPASLWAVATSETAPMNLVGWENEGRARQRANEMALEVCEIPDSNDRQTSEQR